MIKVLLIDDESLALKALALMLEKYCPEVRVLGKATNIEDAYNLILEQVPDLIFLDINMPKGSGLDLIQRISYLHTKVIFTTAHQEYAIDALRQSAHDYLLKPINKEELQAAVLRFLNDQFQKINPQQIHPPPQRAQVKKLSISTLDGIHLLEITSIHYVSSSKNYSVFHSADGELISSRSLGEYEKELKDYGFLRIHRSTLVNLSEIVKFKKGKNASIQLKNGTELEVSRSRRDEVLELLSSP